MDKSELRKISLARRNSLSFSQVETMSQNIALRLLQLPVYEQAQTILIYLSMPKEVVTQSIIATAWQQQKRIVVPVCQPADKSLLLSELHGFDELAPGTWNIPEPKKEYLRPLDPLKIDLAVITGLAFDLRGCRLGYGAGYFDRFLPKLKPDCPIAALTYEFTLGGSLPCEDHDIPVDYLITEANTYYVKR